MAAENIAAVYPTVQHFGMAKVDAGNGVFIGFRIALWPTTFFAMAMFNSDCSVFEPLLTVQLTDGMVALATR